MCLGLAQEASASTVDLDVERGSETACRDRGLGGTLEADTEGRPMETPIMSMANQTGDSSCPLWLRKVCKRVALMLHRCLPRHHL